VEKEAPDKLNAIKPHHLVSSVIGIIPPLKKHRIVIDPHYTTVADGDAMSIATEVAKHRTGIFKRRLQIDYPLLSTQPTQKRLEDMLTRKVRCFPGKDKIASFPACRQIIKELPPEESRERPYGKEEAPARHAPCRSSPGETTAGDDTMQMRVIHKVLPPGMEDA